MLFLQLSRNYSGNDVLFLGDLYCIDAFVHSSSTWQLVFNLGFLHQGAMRQIVEKIMALNAPNRQFREFTMRQILPLPQHNGALQRGARHDR